MERAEAGDKLEENYAFTREFLAKCQTDATGGLKSEVVGTRPVRHRPPAIELAAMSLGEKRALMGEALSMAGQLCHEFQGAKCGPKTVARTLRAASCVAIAVARQVMDGREPRLLQALPGPCMHCEDHAGKDFPDGAMAGKVVGRMAVAVGNSNGFPCARLPQGKFALPALPPLHTSLIGPESELAELIGEQSAEPREFAPRSRIPTFILAVRKLPTTRLILKPLQAVVKTAIGDADSGQADPSAKPVLSTAILPGGSLHEHFVAEVAAQAKSILREDPTALQNVFAQCCGCSAWLPRDKFQVVLVTTAAFAPDLRVLFPSALMLVQPGAHPKLGVRPCVGLSRGIVQNVCAGLGIRTALVLDDSLYDLAPTVPEDSPGSALASVVSWLDADSVRQQPRSLEYDLGITPLKAFGESPARGAMVVPIGRMALRVMSRPAQMYHTLSQVNRNEHLPKALVLHVQNLWTAGVSYNMASEVGEDMEFTASVLMAGLSVGHLVNGDGAAFKFQQPTVRPMVCGGTDAGAECALPTDRAVLAPSIPSSRKDRWACLVLSHSPIAWANGHIVAFGQSGIGAAFSVFGPHMVVSPQEAAAAGRVWREMVAAKQAHWFCQPAVFSEHRVAESDVQGGPGAALLGARVASLGAPFFEEIRRLGPEASPRMVADLAVPAGSTNAEQGRVEVGMPDPSFGGFVRLDTTPLNGGKQRARGMGKYQLIHAELAAERSRLFCAMAATEPTGLDDASCALPKATAEAFRRMAVALMIDAEQGRPPADMISDVGLNAELLFYGTPATQAPRMWLAIAACIYSAASSLVLAYAFLRENQQTGTALLAIQALSGIAAWADMTLCKFLHFAEYAVLMGNTAHGQDHLLAAASRAVGLALTAANNRSVALPKQIFPDPRQAAGVFQPSSFPAWTQQKPAGAGQAQSAHDDLIKRAANRVSVGWDRWEPPAKRPFR